MTDSPLQHKPLLRIVTSESIFGSSQARTAVKPKAPVRRRTKATVATAGDYPLRAILDIPIPWVSKRTVEQLCHLDTPDAALTDEQRKERCLLREYGLEVKQAIGALPAAIVLTRKRLFRRTLSKFKHLANLLEESGGVVPYTPGYPRIDTESSPPAPMSQSGTPLLAVLQAKLTPDLTVEQVCHIPIAEELLSPRAEFFLEDMRLLREAGLGTAYFDEARLPGTTIPEGIVLVDERAFAATFPELAHLIPLLKEVEGVVPYTRGLPRIIRRSTTPRVGTHLRLVSTSRA